MVFPMRLAAACGGVSQAQDVLNELKALQEADQMAIACNTPWCKTVTKRSPMRHTLVVDVAKDACRKNWQADEEFVSQMRQLWGNLAFTYNEEGFGKLRRAESSQNKAHSFTATDSWSQLCAGKIFESFGYSEMDPDPDQPAGLATFELPNSIHNTKRLEASSQKLKDVMGQKTWPGLSPQNSCALAAEQHLLVEACKKGPAGLGQVMSMWRTAFLARGLIVRMKLI